jgi:gliding motility-associated-like protein
VAPAVAISASSTSICSGASITFTATPTNGGTPTYQWKINGVNIAGQTSAIFTTSSLANGDAVTVAMTSSDPCANPATVTSNPINISSTSVAPAVAINASTTSICSGGSITFTATPTNGGTPTYQWKINGVNIAGQTSAIFTTSSLAKGDAVTVAMTSSDPCANPATVTSNPINISSTSVTPAVAISASSTSICSGASVTFTATPTNGGTPTYQWKINGVNVPGQTSSVFTTSSLANGNSVTVVMTSSDPCANPTAATSNAVTIQVSPVITGVRYATLTATANVPLQLQARTLGNNYTYQWSPSIGLSFSNIKDPVFNFDKQTEYLIKMTSGLGCITVDTLLVKLINTPYVFVPSAWTPNGDGHNDYLYPLTINITQLKYFRIFNRWGVKVFETNILGEGWDGKLQGKPQPIDVYTWTIEAISSGGYNYKNSGRSVLLR